MWAPTARVGGVIGTGPGASWGSWGGAGACGPLGGTSHGAPRGHLPHFVRDTHRPRCQQARPHLGPASFANLPASRLSKVPKSIKSYNNLSVWCFPVLHKYTRGYWVESVHQSKRQALRGHLRWVGGLPRRFTSGVRFQDDVVVLVLVPPLVDSRVCSGVDCFAGVDN